MNLVDEIIQARQKREINTEQLANKLIEALGKEKATCLMIYLKYKLDPAPEWPKGMKPPTG